MFLHFDTLEDLLAAKRSLEELTEAPNAPSIDRLMEDLPKRPSQTH